MNLIGICDNVKIISKARLPEPYREYHGKTAKIMDIRQEVDESERSFYLDIDNKAHPWKEWMFVVMDTFSKSNNKSK